MIGQRLAGGIAGLLFAFGAGALAAPSRSAALGFGIPVDDADGAAFVRATGSRDVLLGTLIVASLGDAYTLARLLRATALVGVADAIVVIATRGLRPQLVLHLGGAAAIVAAAAALDRGR